MIEKWLVAIVDDELDIVNLFRESIRTIKAISVFGFTDPMVVLQRFRWNKNSYILIICDLKMPTLCGIELIKQIKMENPSVRTLLMTAFEIDDKLFDDITKKQIINGFLQKPIKLQNLLSEVNKQINAHKIGLGIGGLRLELAFHRTFIIGYKYIIQIAKSFKRRTEFQTRQGVIRI